MIDIYICEDNEKQLLAIKQKIENYVAMEQLDMQITVASQKPEDIVQQARHSKNCGLYFLDIDLKNSEMNGFLMAQEIREIEPRCFIVFVTSHIELCAYTFRYKVEALDFIMKDEPEKWASKSGFVCWMFIKNIPGVQTLIRIFFRQVCRTGEVLRWSMMIL